MAVVYGIYAVFSIFLTVWLARTLFRNGQVLLEDVFAGQPGLATAVNRLLVVGFYLVNFGYACLLLTGGRATDVVGAIETLATKMGWLLMSLAVMHFMNLFIFQRIRRRARLASAPPPVAPRYYVPPVVVPVPTPSPSA
jgi:hypothetical protein